MTQRSAVTLTATLVMAVAVGGIAPLLTASTQWGDSSWYWMLLCLTVLLGAAFRGSFRSRISPATVFYTSWGGQFGLLALPIFDYHLDTPHMGDLAYIAAVLLTAGLGFHLGSRLGRQAPTDPAARLPASPASNWVPLAIGLLGIVGQLATLYDATVLTGLPVVDRIFSDLLDVVRQTHFENLQEQRQGPLVLLETALSPLSYLSLALYFVRQPRFLAQNPGAQLVIGSSFALIVVNSLFSYGGRIGIVLAIAVVVVARYLSPARRRATPASETVEARRRPAFGRRLAITGTILLLVAVGWQFSTSYLADRAGTVTPARLLDLHRARLQPWAAEAARDHEALAYFFVSLNYFSSPTPTLVRYLQVPEEQLAGPYAGQYSLYLLARPFTFVLGDERTPSFFDMRLEIFEPLTAAGYAGNVWATSARDLIVDFGRYGAIAAILVLSLLSGIAFAASEATRRHDRRVLACFVLIGWFWFPFHLLTTATMYLVPLVVIAAFVVARPLWSETEAGKGYGKGRAHFPSS